MWTQRHSSTHYSIASPIAWQPPLLPGSVFQQDPDDDWLDSRQAAEYLGVHRDTLRRLAAARAIPAVQDGRGCKLFFQRAALDDWRLDDWLKLYTLDMTYLVPTPGMPTGASG